MFESRKILCMILQQGALNRSKNIYSVTGKDSFGGIIEDPTGLNLNIIVIF